MSKSKHLNKLPTKSQILREIARDFEQTDIKTNFAGSLSNIKTNSLINTNSLIKTNKSEEDLFWEEYQKMKEEENNE